MTRGYFGIGIQAAKTPANVGGLWRSAHAFGAAFVYTVGHRYPTRLQPTDTTFAERHVPLHEHDDVDAFLAAIPRGARLVGVECGVFREPTPLQEFRHPERAVYVLGAEDRGLSPAVLERVDDLVEIPSALCLNVATAGAIVLYDRAAKTARRAAVMT